MIAKGTLVRFSQGTWYADFYNTLYFYNSTCMRMIQAISKCQYKMRFGNELRATQKPALERF